MMRSMSLHQAVTELQLDMQLAKYVSTFPATFTQQTATQGNSKLVKAFKRLQTRGIIIKTQTTSARLGAWRKIYYTVDRDALLKWREEKLSEKN